MEQWAKESTMSAGWDKSIFHLFLKNANQHEYLQSQIPFFYAVEAFPRMLCKLAMSIETSEQRLLVVENIWEEHGQGNKGNFHTQSYKTYLTSLGWTGETFTNPWVQAWIQKIFAFPNDAIYLASYLSGIEYLYALMSQDIAQYIGTLKLECEQHHYANHAVLDWNHGYELLSVAIDLAKENQENTNKIQQAFKEGQKDFLDMYCHLRIPTLKEAYDIHQENISFYYIREDSNIEKSVLENFISQKKIDTQDVSCSILSIASGGEHIFEYLSHGIVMDIDVIDINLNQINLAKKKLDMLLSDNPCKNEQAIFTENDVGKFEKMFSLLRSFLSEQEIEQLKESNHVEKLKYVTDILFSNPYLNIIFGEDATKYTVLNFAEHFYTLFLHRLALGEANTMNVFTTQQVRDYDALSDKVKLGFPLAQLTWQVSNPKNNQYSKQYDMINLSNIGDWMEFDDYTKMIENLKNNLKSGGCIIARKLLGDYNLKHTFEKMAFNCIIKQDETYFYTETVLAYYH